MKAIKHRLLQDRYIVLLRSYKLVKSSLEPFQSKIELSKKA